jgi:16S rRNA (guanine966-N2)-methyltransferase
MRVVAGTHRGRRLSAPPGLQVRPTSDRVREALFSILGPVTGARVLDLFAGSGALGIEALSRGAGSAVFVDSDPVAAGAVRENLARLGLEAGVHRQDALAFLGRSPPAPGEAFDLVFLDPPYSSAGRLAASLSERLPVVLAPEARIVTESDTRHPLTLDLPLAFERTYGRTLITIHRGG